jgi:hypothetical protein
LDHFRLAGHPGMLGKGYAEQSIPASDMIQKGRTGVDQFERRP